MAEISPFASPNEAGQTRTNMRDLPTGTVTLLFTDIEGSTLLLQQLGERYADILATCRQLLRTAFQQWNGVEVDTQGDAFFVVFARASDAVSAVVNMQRALARHDWPNGAAVALRIGLHTGEPSVGAEGYIGLDVHHAARIMSVGHGGQVLLSQTTRDLVEHDLRDEVSLRDLGEHRLKDLQRPVHLYQLVIADLSANFPPLKTLDTYPHNLPVQPTTLIGRENEVAAVVHLLQREDVGLVTLTGPGGVGKTRLGLQVAAELAEHFIDGVFFMNLAPVSDPALVVPTVAQTLGILESASQSLLERLREQLQQRRVLLLLDNFEQVVSASVQMADLLTACPKLKLLVTSREVLHVRAEYEFVVPPLALPDPSSLSEQEAFSHFASVTLFLQRVRTVKPDFQLTAANAHAIAEICVRLDGVPLAIELAAARMKLFTPQELLARLSHGLQILTSGARDAPLRHQTLRNTIAWSYDLLKAEEQQLFWRLSVFVGGCTLEAVETICAERDDGVRSALDGVTSLIDKSLVQHMEQEGYDSRLVMLETIREYGRERLTASEEEERIRRAHANYYLALVEEAEPHLKGAQQLLWLRRLDRAQENLRTALSWLIAHEEGEQTLRFCVALWWFWQTRGYWSEGRRWLKAALALPSAGERTLLRARALSAAGELAGAQTDWQEANQLLSESMTLFKEVGDDGGFVLPLSTMGWILVRQGEYAAAAPIIEECIIRCRKLGRTWELCRVLLWLGNLTYLQGDLAQATALYQEGLALARELGDRTLIYRGLNNMGYALYLQGDLVQATVPTQEGLALARELGDKLFIFQTLETLGSIALSQGDLEQAITYFTEGLSVAQELGNETHIKEGLSLELSRDMLITWHLIGLARVAIVQKQLMRAARLFAAAEVRYDVNKQMSPDQRDDYKRTVGSLRAQLGEQAFKAAWAEGLIMTIEQILAEPEPVRMFESDPMMNTLPAIDKSPATPNHPDGLSVRELEVLRLLATGLTDAQIAEQLVLSLHTIHAHLRTIYSKLGVTSRSAATRYAFEHQLV